MLVIAACHSSNSGLLAPNVVNYTVAAAIAKLKLSGLVLGTQTTASSATVPAGEIISQSPLAGYSIAHGSAINVVVSTGPVALAASGGALPAAVTQAPGLTATIQSAAQSAATSTSPAATQVSTPLAGLTQSSDGNYYGISTQGGAYRNQGTFFRVSASGTRVILYSFGAKADDAVLPDTSLVQAADGSFYGTSATGGSYGEGTVFRVTAAGVENVLYAFSAGSGVEPANPASGLIQGADGDFYGTTRSGGTNGTGVVFRLTPAGALSVLYSLGSSH